MPECSNLFKSVNCITLGAPMVGNRAFKNTINSYYRDNFEHWMREHDPVPLFPQCPTLLTRILASIASKAVITASSLDPITTEFEDEYNSAMVPNKYHSAGTIYTISANMSSSALLVKQVESVEQAYTTWSYVKYHETGCFVKDFAAHHLMYKYIEDLTRLVHNILQFE